jgi:hypothetical protein
VKIRVQVLWQNLHTISKKCKAQKERLILLKSGVYRDKEWHIHVSECSGDANVLGTDIHH